MADIVFAVLIRIGMKGVSFSAITIRLVEIPFVAIRTTMRRLGSMPVRSGTSVGTSHKVATQVWESIATDTSRACLSRLFLPMFSAITHSHLFFALGGDEYALGFIGRCDFQG